MLVCHYLLWQVLQTAVWMIHKSKGASHRLTRTFSNLTCAWSKELTHHRREEFTTELITDICMFYMKGMKYLGRKWQLALSSDMILSNKYKLIHEWIRSESVWVLQTFNLPQTFSKDTQSRRSENRRRQPDIETRWALTMFGYCFQLGVGALWRSVKLFD